MNSRLKGPVMWEAMTSCDALPDILTEVDIGKNFMKYNRPRCCYHGHFINFDQLKLKYGYIITSMVSCGR